MSIDFSRLPTPCYVCDESVLRENLEILKGIKAAAACRILLALKGFSMFSMFPLVKQYLDGTCATSLFEARLGSEEMKGEVHVGAPAYREEEFDELIGYADHINFNSISQYRKYGKLALAKGLACGLRINPEYSEVETDIYNPCGRYSRLGVTRDALGDAELDGISGFSFHALCEQNADTLERVLGAVEEKFGDLLGNMRWINFGGGHHITRKDYDRDLLVRLINTFKEKYDVEVILEPGEAVALNAGYLVTRVLDIIHNELDIAILDTSAPAHMPDVLEMPYRPRITGAGAPGEYANTYRLGGMTCLAGDVIGDYAFPEPLKIGDRLVFHDMLHYTMVKNNTFNGINLPAIVVWTEQDEMQVVREFGYDDYRRRLS